MTTQPSSSIAGEYYLQGVMEMASGFLLSPDGKFQFFFTYGALDRYGSGNWVIKNDTIIMNSTTKPGTDFALINSKAGTDEVVSVRIKILSFVLNNG